MENFKKKCIRNKNVKEIMENLLDSPVKYQIVSERAKLYNFHLWINYKLKPKFENNKKLSVNKIIGDFNYFKN